MSVMVTKVTTQNHKQYVNDFFLSKILPNNWLNENRL